MEKKKKECSSDLGSNFRIKVILLESGSEVFKGEGDTFHGSSAASLVGFFEELLELGSLFVLCVG